MAKLAVFIEDGAVVDVFRATPQNSNYFENGGRDLPDSIRLYDEGTDVHIEDLVDEQGNIDTTGHVRAQKRREISDARYHHETAGVKLQGMNIATDRESQSLITGAALQATVDSSYSCQWKTQGGFVTLTSAQILGIAQAVRAHVQSCFDKEAELLAKIDKAKTKEEIERISWGG